LLESGFFCEWWNEFLCHGLPQTKVMRGLYTKTGVRRKVPDMDLDAKLPGRTYVFISVSAGVCPAGRLGRE
ncbi:MAG TPA: hypothetical protein VFP96_18350, partial [Candidatus Acidoferrum sp.]|nr:hypothetical protein [Candidatus Acidoferrum sp.]